MAGLTDLSLTSILRPGYGTVFIFGSPRVGAHVGVVYLFDDGATPLFGGVPTPYYVRFTIARTWDKVLKYYLAGWVPEGKRPLTAEETLYFRMLATGEKEFA